MKKFTIIFLFPLLLLSCSSNKYVWINYSVNNVPVSEKVETIPISVNFHILSDNRANIEENKILFTEPHLITINEKKYCFNSEQHYRQDSVVTQISRLFVKHANKVKLFTQTSLNESIGNEYYLTGTLNSFYGEQEFSTAADAGNAAGVVAGVLFGVIGGAIAGGIAGGIAGAATSNMKTPGKIIIEMSDLKLFKNNGTLVKDFGSFFQEYKGDFREDGTCWCIYENVNVMLKDFNAKLIEKIREELEGVAF